MASLPLRRETSGESGEKPRNLPTHLEGLIRILMTSGGMETDLNSDDEIQRDQRVIETIDGVENGFVQSGWCREGAGLSERQRRLTDVDGDIDLEAAVGPANPPTLSGRLGRDPSDGLSLGGGGGDG